MRNEAGIDPSILQLPEESLPLPASMANFIAIERSRRIIKISFLEYLKVGIPLTPLTLWVGILILD